MQQPNVTTTDSPTMTHIVTGQVKGGGISSIAARRKSTASNRSGVRTTTTSVTKKRTKTPKTFGKYEFVFTQNKTYSDNVDALKQIIYDQRAKMEETENERDELGHDNL